MNRRTECPGAFPLIPYDGMAPHRQAGHGEGGEKPNHRGTNQIVVNVARGQECCRSADCHL